ncbi:hypothetical protein FQN57_004228 [Myotisia sp. PD_48]|nr:hypothetical protein FQN57_004228 [Myotisia sp. PD_48]
MKPVEDGAGRTESDRLQQSHVGGQQQQQQQQQVKRLISSDSPQPLTEKEALACTAQDAPSQTNTVENQHDEKAGQPPTDLAVVFPSITRDQTRTSVSRHSADPESHYRLGSRMSTDPDGNTYPEGGSEAYTVVFGSFLVLFGGFGLVNTIGTFQAYISANQLKDLSQREISWIFGVFSFLIFFGGLQIGPIFDAKGPKLLVFVGSILLIVGLITLGFCEQYWHFMLSFGLVCGAGSSLTFTPAVATPGHWFYRLRGRATGIASTGGSVGGVVMPLMLEALFPKIGFAWATRALALVCLVFLGVGLFLVKGRLPKKKATKENILPDLKILLDLQFFLTTFAIFFIEWGLFVPLTYLTSYALKHGMKSSLSYQLIAILNAGSFFGRWIPGFISDYSGRFNTMIITVLMCLLSTACLWLLAGDNTAMLVAYAFIFGFSSGSNIGLTPVCVGQICKTEHYGRYYATAYTVVSFGTLTGTPIAGAILTLNDGNYWGLITWTSCCYFAGLVCFIAAKGVKVGWNPFTLY